MAVRAVTLRMTDEEIDAVDEARGGVPREVWIRGAILKRIELKEPPKVYSRRKR